MFQENLSIYPDIKYGDGGLVAKLCLTLLTPWTMACQTPVPMGFPRQEYWNELPFPSPGDLTDPGIKPVFLLSPALLVDLHLQSHLESLRYVLLY